MADEMNIKFGGFHAPFLPNTIVRQNLNNIEILCFPDSDLIFMHLGRPFKRNLSHQGVILLSLVISFLFIWLSSQQSDCPILQN